MAKKRIGIVGGGIIGTAVAYFLTHEHPDAEVYLFEKNTIGSGTTAKSAGTHCLIDDSLPHEFWSVRLFGFKFYTDLEKRIPGSTGFEKTGTLLIAPYPEYERYALQAVDLAVASGYEAVYWKDKDKIRTIIPDLTLDGVLGAAYSPDDGFLDATMTSNTLARLSREKGAKIMIGTEVQNVSVVDNKVTGVDTNKGHFDLDVLVDSTGPWAPFFGAKVGMQSPIIHTRAEVFILKPEHSLGYPFPVLKFPRFYARKDKDNVFICKAHLTMDLNNPQHAGLWNPDDLPMTGGTDPYFWDFLTDELMKHYPRLLDSSVANDWVGYRAEPRDYMPVLGPSPIQDYVLAIGAGGNGVIEGPTIGRDIARYVMTGETSYFIERLPLARFDDPSRVEKMHKVTW
jgi:sarcosine oxidase subunit beta